MLLMSVTSEYQQQHNDIAIQYTVAGSDDLATEDVLKALNTELLAGICLTITTIRGVGYRLENIHD